MKDRMTQVSLRTCLNTCFLRLVTSFAEESAKAFGLGEPEALKLTLACEEVFAYLCRISRVDDMITIEVENGGYYVRFKFLFKAEDFNLKAFNLTSTVSLGDAENLDEMGLLIASRLVERFYFTEDLQRRMGLVLIKEKSYPALAGLEIPEIKTTGNFYIKTPDPDSVKIFIRLVTAHYPAYLYIESFLMPGKVVDMIESGEYGVKLAMNERGQTSGGIVWRWIGTRTVEFFGPYLFGQPVSEGLPGELVTACIEQIAKTDAVGLISRYSTPELPEDFFESLGVINFVQSDGIVRPRLVHYRQLREDTGCRIWAHPKLADFLRAEYSRLFFTREILLTRHEGEQRPPNSIFAPEFDRVNRQINLRVVWDGADAAGNLAQHVKILKAEGLPNIFFEIDLAYPWQAGLTPALLDNGFQPRLVLPYGGKADVVVFQFQGGE